MEPFIQRAEIRAWSVTVDYKPRRVDVAALRQGAFLEVRPGPDRRLALRRNANDYYCAGRAGHVCTVSPHWLTWSSLCALQLTVTHVGSMLAFISDQTTCKHGPG